MKKIILKLLILLGMLSIAKPASSQNLLVNGDFNTPYSYIVPVYSTPPPMNKWGYWSAVYAWAGLYNGVCYYQIYWPSANTWDVQLAYWGFQLSPGHSYRLKFDVKSDYEVNRSFGVFIGEDGGAWRNFNLNYIQLATTDWQTKTIEFKVPMTFSLNKLSFEIGGNSNLSFWEFDNISLEDIGPYTPQCLSDGSFNTPLTIEPIGPELNNPPTLNKWLRFLYDNGDASAAVADGVCKYHIINPGDYLSYIQLVQYGFDLIQGHNYRLSFDVKSDAPRTFGLYLGEYFGEWFHYLGWDKYEQSSTTEWQTKTFDFTATSAFIINQLSFEMGAFNIDMYFDNIVLKDLAYPDQIISISSTPDVANNFCNGMLLTANSNVAVQSYAWSNGVNTQTNFLTTANPSGVYTVKVTSAASCPDISSASFDYDKQALTSSYTLLARNSIKLQSYNTVKKGSVGVVNSGGTISMKKNVNIDGAGAFLKADNISTYLPSSILQIPDPVSGVVMPEIPPHTSPTSSDPNATIPNNTTIEYGNLRNVTIGTNCNVTLTGSIFGNITIGSGSKVLFTQPYINVTAITMNAGTVSVNTQLKFSEDATVRVAGSILVNTRCDVNPDNNKVVMYLGKTNNAPVAFTVGAGGFVTVNASMYIPYGKISVGGDAINMTYMNGKFIAENIETLDKNVIWNWYDCTPAAAATPLITSKNSNANTEQPTKPITGLIIKAWPNPSEHQFILNVESNSNEVVTIRVYDMFGRIIYSTTGTANRQYQFGNRFVSGAYVAEVRQGVNRSSVKLIKQ